MVNYTDYVWQKYRIGLWTKESDPKTGVCPRCAIFIIRARQALSLTYTSEDPSNPDSAAQDFSVQGLQGARRENS